MLLALDEDEEPHEAQHAQQPQPQAQQRPQSRPQDEDPLGLFGDEFSAFASSSSSAPKPPPPPPPKKADIDEVWTPLEDSTIQGCLAQEKTGDLLLGTDPAMAAFLFGADAPLAAEKKKKQEAEQAFNLLDLEDSLLPPPGPTASSSSSAGADFDFGPGGGGSVDLGGGGGLLADLPADIAAAVEKPKGKTMLDLSGPAERAEQAAAEEKEKARKAERAAAAGAAARSSSASRGPARAIDPEAKGFGSDDLFGKRPEDRQIHEQVRDEGVNAYNTVKAYLPENLSTQMPSCTAPTHADEETELVVGASPSDGRPPAEQRNLDPNSLEAQHEQRAMDRTFEGRWVPTYMRQQLAANGHTTLPTTANGHEFNASAPPPSLGEALLGMGEEMGETAQTVFAFFASLFSTLTVQCQVCSAHSASTLHESVMDYGENLCHGRPEDTSTELTLGRPTDESLAGLGPMRSRVQRTLPGVIFADLALLVRTKLVTGVMPLALSQVIRSREVTKTSVQQMPPIEDFMFSTELSPEAVPEAFLEHLCRRADNAMERRAFRCVESWHVELEQGQAMVEMTNAPAGGSVVITIRMDITSLPPSQGVGCSVDSRVYAKRREFGEVLPVGLVEQLAESHHAYSEALHNVILSVAQAAPNDAFTAPKAGMAMGAGSVPVPPPHHLQASGIASQAAFGSGGAMGMGAFAKDAHTGAWGEGAAHGYGGTGSAFGYAAPAADSARTPAVPASTCGSAWTQGPSTLKDSIPKDSNVALDANFLLKVAHC